jgi:hypothetical protein
MTEANELRKLAAWYREFAEHAGAPTIWEMRLKTAAKLEFEATRVDRVLAHDPTAVDVPAAASQDVSPLNQAIVSPRPRDLTSKAA